MTPAEFRLATVLVVGILYMCNWAGRSGEWVLMKEEHVRSQLAGGFHYVVCPNHKTSSTLGEAVKHLSESTRRALLCYMDLPAPFDGGGLLFRNSRLQLSRCLGRFGKLYSLGVQQPTVNLMRKRFTTAVFDVYHRPDIHHALEVASKHSGKTAVSVYCAMSWDQQAITGQAIYKAVMGEPPEWPLEVAVGDVTMTFDDPADEALFAAPNDGPDETDSEPEDEDDEGDADADDGEGNAEAEGDAAGEKEDELMQTEEETAELHRRKRARTAEAATLSPRTASHLEPAAANSGLPAALLVAEPVAAIAPQPHTPLRSPHSCAERGPPHTPFVAGPVAVGVPPPRTPPLPPPSVTHARTRGRPSSFTDDQLAFLVAQRQIYGFRGPSNVPRPFCRAICNHGIALGNLQENTDPEAVRHVCRYEPDPWTDSETDDEVFE